MPTISPFVPGVPSILLSSGISRRQARTSCPKFTMKAGRRNSELGGFAVDARKRDVRRLSGIRFPGGWAAAASGGASAGTASAGGAICVIVGPTGLALRYTANPAAAAQMTMRPAIRTRGVAEPLFFTERCWPLKRPLAGPRPRTPQPHEPTTRSFSVLCRRAIERDGGGTPVRVPYNSCPRHRLR